MLTTVLWTTILMAAMLAGCLQARTLGDIRALKAGKADRSTPTMDSLSPPENGAAAIVDRNVQSTSPVRYPLGSNREVKVQDWRVVLFTQSARPYCRQSAPVLKTFSQKAGFDIFPINLDGKSDAEFPDVFPATSDVMVEYFQSGLPVATPATPLTNVNMMETWSLPQGAVEADKFCSRLSEVLRMALGRQSEKNIPLSVQGQQ